MALSKKFANAFSAHGGRGILFFEQAQAQIKIVVINLISIYLLKLARRTGYFLNWS